MKNEIFSTKNHFTKTSFLFILMETESMNSELNERHQIVLLSDIKAHRVGIETTEIKKWRINACQAIRVTAQWSNVNALLVFISPEASM